MSELSHFFSQVHNSAFYYEGDSIDGIYWSAKIAHHITKVMRNVRHGNVVPSSKPSRTLIRTVVGVCVVVVRVGVAGVGVAGVGAQYHHDILFCQCYKSGHRIGYIQGI